MSHQSFVFTRNLYARDEVEASLFTALLQKRELKEIYFWAYELHYSGFDLFRVLWRIYYDVYFELNPLLEKYLSKKQEIWETTKQADVFAFCLKNMRFCKPSSNVFLLRQHAEVTNKKGGSGYKGRPPSWCAYHPKKYHSWLRAISKKDYSNIALHTYSLVREYDGAADHMYRELVAYFAGVMDVEQNADVYWNARKYFDDAHYLLSIVLYLVGNKVVEQEPCLMTPSPNHLKFLLEFGNEHIDECPQYNILGERRVYGINPCIGCFQLARYQDKCVTNLNSLYDLNSIWEKFVFQTPYWIRVFESQNATFDTTHKRVYFPNDEALEDFYDTYGCEPDEQTSDVRDKSLGAIPCANWRHWYDAIFDEPSIIDFDNTFQFRI